MILYFNNKRISNNWEKIKFVLEKIKNDWVQKWADTTIRIFLPFQEEKSQWLEENKKSLEREDIENFTNKPLFLNWNQMIILLENFFITTEFWANAIKNLKKVKQDSQIVKDYWLDFCA